MIALVMWHAAILLELAIIWRGVRTGLFSKYPFFYSYIASVLLADGSLYFVRLARPALYPKWNWAAALLSLTLGYGIILEIFKHVLASYPGVERLARIGGLVIFVLILTFATGYPLLTVGTPVSSSKVQLERDFWTVQVIFLFAVFGLVSYYRIPIGRNIRGIIFGYGFCRATTLMALTLRSYIGPTFKSVSNIVEPLSYLISLVVWVIALWSAHPDLVAEPGPRLETDYEALALRTRSVMGVMRSHLTKVARP